LVSYIKGRTQAEGFENRELRGLFVPIRGGVTGEWSALQKRGAPWPVFVTKYY
jgi:hypothetical protein